jgi:hypothetical protein
VELGGVDLGRSTALSRERLYSSWYHFEVRRWDMVVFVWSDGLSSDRMRLLEGNDGR